jgi:NDP-hexose-3-ketoreductase
MEKVERTRLVAVASRERSRAERFATRFDCDVADSYDALLLRDDIDAIYVPLPVGLRPNWIEKALLAGKHVLAEKPLSSDPETARFLFDMANALGLHLVENFMFLHHSQHHFVKELLDCGVVGELRSFVSSFTIPPRPDDDIRYVPSLGNGALLDLGVYPIRAALYFLGHELDLVGAMLREDRMKQVVLSGHVLLAAPDGTSAQLSFGMENSYRTSYELIGTLGNITSVRAFTPPDTYEPVIRVERQSYREERTLPADEQFCNALNFFAQTTQDGGGQGSCQRGSLRVAELIQKIHEQATRHEV